MEQFRELLGPLIGQLVWSVRRGVGTFLTMEFGGAHLAVREPIQPRSSSSEKAQRSLVRRRVSVVGDWHLWIKYGEWKLSAAQGALDSRTPLGSPLDECLRDLDGQKLASIDAGAASNSLVLAFDLGARLEIWPSAEIPDDQWSLHRWDGDIAAYQSDGSLVFEKPKGDTSST
jgi:hypothetical protein